MNLEDFSFFHKLKKLPFIEEIWVYGSRARGDNSDRSDIDLAMLCPSATEQDWVEVSEILENADTLLKIDCVRFDTLLNPKLEENILKFKKIVYKKGSGYMEKEFWREYFDSLGEAIQRLEEVLRLPNLQTTDHLQGAAIHYFEFCIELYWKVLKKFLAFEKVETTTPRDVLAKAYQFGLIDDEKVWLEMLDDRNITSHLYRQKEAKRVFEKIMTLYWPVIEKNYAKLKDRFEAPH